MDKTKTAHAMQTFLRLKVYLALYIEELALLCNIMLFLLKSLIQCFGGKNSLHGYSQSDYHQIYFTGLKKKLFTTPYFLLQNVACGLSI